MGTTRRPRRTWAGPKDATGDAWKDLRHGVNRDLHKLRAKLREAHEKIEKA